MKEALFDVSLQVKRLLHDQASSLKVSGPTSIKLPKISVPTFHGNLIELDYVLGSVQTHHT